jgi:hypothetical protein
MACIRIALVRPPAQFGCPSESSAASFQACGETVLIHAALISPTMAVRIENSSSNVGRQFSAIGGELRHDLLVQPHIHGR